jgi:hypothetical protein
MGYCRDQGQAGTIPRDRRVRHLRQLHLPFCEDPALHRPGFSGVAATQAGRGMRCFV